MDNTVLVIFEISIVKREVIPNEYKLNIINYFEGIAVDVLNNIINKLKDDDKEIYHYESKLFNYSRDKVVEIMRKLSDIYIGKGDLKSITKLGDDIFEGQIINFTTKNGNEIKIKIDKVKMDKDDIKWSISYMPLDISYSDYSVEWNVIKVKENQTLLIIHNIYYEQIEPSVIIKLTEKKKNIFSIMKKELKKKYP